jgi:hypothetical protein
VKPADFGYDPLTSAIHESGHAAAALVLGFTVNAVDIIFRQLPGRKAFGGQLRYQPNHARGCDPVETALRRVAVAYAGPLAEARWTGAPPEMIGPDRTIAVAGALFLNPGDPGPGLKAGRELADALLDRPANWSALMSCAEELAERREMNGKKFERLFTDARALEHAERQMEAITVTLRNVERRLTHGMHL